MTCLPTGPTLYFPDWRLFANRVLWARTTISVLIEPGILLRLSSVLVSAGCSVVEPPVALLSIGPRAQREP